MTRQLKTARILTGLATVAGGTIIPFTTGLRRKLQPKRGRHQGKRELARRQRQLVSGHRRAA